MPSPRLLVFASGDATGGGSGFKKLVLSAREGSLDANVLAVVSNHATGGVRDKAEQLGIPFIHFPKPWTAEGYQWFVRYVNADFVALSGWLKLVAGLDPSTTFNIHPGLVPEMGGKGLWGHHVHEATVKAFKEGRIRHTAVCMHYVTPKYDDGPNFLRFLIKMREDDTPEILQKRVNVWEHYWQPQVTNLVVNRAIRWSGNPKDKVEVPDDYKIVRFEDEV